jgi:hypothetical protein
VKTRDGVLSKGAADCSREPHSMCRSHYPKSTSGMASGAQDHKNPRKPESQGQADRKPSQSAALHFFLFYLERLLLGAVCSSGLCLDPSRS